MMREARPPHSARGSLRACSRCCAAAAPRWLLAVVLLLCAIPQPAHAQDPSVLSTTPGLASSFPKQQGGILGGPVQKIDRSKPLYLQGDELIYDTKGNKIRARGNVEIFYNNYILKADEVQYDQTAGTLTAIGNVELREPNGNIVRAERYTLSEDFRDGFIQSLSAVTKDDTRIVGERATRRDGNVTEFEKGKFTPCKNTAGMPPLWCLSAEKIVHDQANATITYQDAYFEIYGQPVLYLPYFQHADPSVKRKSGFLIPEISNSSTLGFMVEVPYYFALAPNYDFTFHPMYTAKQGVLWQGDWRHRLSFGDITGQYDIQIAAIDQSEAVTRAVGNSLPDNWRGSVKTRGEFSLASWWKFGWDVTVESDDTFRRYYKLDNILQTDRVNSIYLRGQSERNYFAMTAYQFGGLLLSDTTQSESWVHPVIDWTYVVGQPVLGGELSFASNAVAQSRNNGDGTSVTNRLTGKTTQIERVSTDANWRRRLTDNIGITYTPFANLRGDLYSVHDGDRSRDRRRHQQRYRRPRRRHRRCPRRLPVACQDRFGIARRRADRADHRAHRQREAALAAGRGRQEHRVRRHQSVRARQDDGLGPHGDRHPPQRRPAVHLPGQQRRHGARPCRSKLPAGRRQHIQEPRHAVRSGHLCDAARHIQCQQRPRDVAFRLCAGHVPGAFVGVPPDRPGTLRRE